MNIFILCIWSIGGDLYVNCTIEFCLVFSLLVWIDYSSYFIHCASNSKGWMWQMCSWVNKISVNIMNNLLFLFFYHPSTLFSCKTMLATKKNLCCYLHWIGSPEIF